MSCFTLLTGIAACDGPPATSLAGSVSCATITCGSGELCVEQAPGVADAGIAVSCDVVDAGCHVTDCSGSACPTCIAEMCADYPSFNAPVLDGRTLSCPGE
jgi:hypothetical protein